MNFISKEEVNTKRQFEFDFAKAVCILGMVFVHCFEEFTISDISSASSLYYTFVTVLNSLFGAGTFMICLGLGLTYTSKNRPEDFIKRGIIIFLLGYLLNFIRYVIPNSLFLFEYSFADLWQYLIQCFVYTDIMQFAGLAFILFGLLKKINLPDWAIGTIAVVMSILGSFFRFINIETATIAEIVGLFVGTTSEIFGMFYFAPFAILNWFIFVVFGYFLGKVIRRCNNMEKFYAITTPVSAVIIITYMAIAIPNQLGMMSGVEALYFQMNTLDAFIIIMGAMFAFGLYHYISKLFNEKVKNLITGLSININKTYCIHWVIIGWLTVIVYMLCPDGIQSYIVVLLAIVIYLISSVLAEIIKDIQNKRRLRKESNND